MTRPLGNATAYHKQRAPVAPHTRRSLPAWLLLGLLLCLSPAPGLAHGGGKPQLSNTPAGPYHIFAWTTPEPWRIGEAHTTVAVTQPDSSGRDIPISGAQVTVIYQPADGTHQPIHVAALEGTGAQAAFYEADAILPSAGAWAVTIQVTGNAGSGEAGFTYSVLPAESGVNWWLIGAGLAGTALVAALLLASWRTQRRAASVPQQPMGS